MKIRKATLNDLDSLTELFGEYRVVSGTHREIEEERFFLERRLEQAGCIVFLAFIDEKLVGFAIISPFFFSKELKEIYLVNDIYTVEEQRHQGVAQSLLSEVVFYAKRNCRQRVQLTTTADNYSAQSLFERFGFKRLDELNFEFIISS
ncbi:GNAT family N-acetyltransferase [Olivibacter sitiensis]|uniref:GNAT family N-acetyltransferase n=1 Tax=Olivibacter sitiensis TaxID=376470 RepID=UPI0003FB393C|nr:GNAT family N-acetyltransferase [Olivibacter sitiensis]